MTAPEDADDAEWVRPRPPAAGIRRDAVVAVALLLCSGLSLVLFDAYMSAVATSPPVVPLWLKVLWVIGISLPLAARRVYPASVAVIVSTVFIVGGQLGVGEVLFSNICLYLAIYTIGAWGRNRRVALFVRTIIVIAMFVWLLITLIVNASDPAVMAQIPPGTGINAYFALSLIQIMQNLLYFAAAIYFGSAGYTGAKRQFELTRKTQQLHDERDQNKKQALVLERIRIARELHDVVAHHVSVMGLQAGAARRVLGKLSSRIEDPAIDKTNTALAAIESNARSAVDELHLMLTTLRQYEVSSPDDANESASTRGIAQLNELLVEARNTGLPAELSVIGDPVEVPVTIGFTVYRIAQESLTNTRKHAGSMASVQVRLRYLEDAVEIEVSDDGIGARSAGSAARAGGFGQIGMSERVAAVGGSIEIGPKPRGGYLVRARLPLPLAVEAPTLVLSDEPPLISEGYNHE